MKMQIPLLLALLIAGFACSNKPEIKQLPSSANVKEEINNLEVAIDISRSENLDLLAPESYKEARNSVKKAKKMEDEDKKKEDVLKEVALGKAYLERAEENSINSRGKLQDVLAAREVALGARANTLLPKPFSKMDEKVKEQTANLENDEDNKLKERRSDFITGYMDLELAAIKKVHISETKFLIDEARKNGARDLTPKTLASANEKYKEADQFISQYRHNTPEIQMYSEVAYQEAKSLEALTAKARGLSAATPEETALKMRAEENRLNRTKDALMLEQGANMALASNNAEMTKDQELNAVYEDARKKFSPEEAEVYKQGKNLIIRLRSLEFPKSQAVIKGENFALLKKVEDVIQSFNGGNVIVEGHTDSTGSKQINQKLSNERALAVKQYLEVNSIDNNIGFESKGYGFEKPLSSNKTASGRAENRRVDIIIEPTSL